MNGVTDFHSFEPFHNQIQHPDPLGEDDYFTGGIVVPDIGEHLLKFVKLRRIPDLLIEYVAGVAAHTHTCQRHLKPFHLIRSQGPPLGEIPQAGDDILILRVTDALIMGHLYKIRVVHSIGKLVANLVLAPAQHDAQSGFVQIIEILHTGNRAILHPVIFTVKTEKAAEKGGVDELGEGVEFVNLVLNRGSGQNERETRFELLDRPRGFRAPVLDALRLVKYHEIWPENLINFLIVAHDLLVVGQQEKRLCVAVSPQPVKMSAKKHLAGKIGEGFNLLLPLRLKRRGRDHQNAPHPHDLAHHRCGGNRLNGFTKSHFIGEHCPPFEGQMQHPVELIAIERHSEKGQRPLSSLEFIAVIRFEFSQKSPIFQFS